MFGFTALSLLGLILLTGCWNRVELDEYAFVQGIAIDLAKDGRNLDLTVQFYNPISGGKEKTERVDVSNERAINVKTRDATVFEAIRDISVHIGRKAQWSHMRVLIIGEELAKKRNIAEILDFFSRDHEPRATIDIMIGKGRADVYLKTKPFIEKNMGQQLREAEKLSYEYAGKTLKTSFLDLMVELKGETEVSAVPYVYFDPKNEPVSSPVTGLAMMKKGRLVSAVQAKKIENLLMLMGKYKGGVIQTACPGQGKQKMKKMESVEVESVKTKTIVKIKNGTAAAHIWVKIRGYAGELICTSLKTPEEAARFNEQIKKMLEEDLRKTLKIIQKQKLDALGIGNRVYRQNPALWERWKPDWEERFARLPITIEVESNVYNTGANTGEHLAK